MGNKNNCSNCVYGCCMVVSGDTGVICRNDMSNHKGGFMKSDCICNFYVSGESREGVDMLDNINHPERYNKHGMECIEEMEHVFGIDIVIGFCKCNAWKYRYRATCEDDAKKADWYMKKLVELEEKKYCMENF